jgi:alpha-D-xyloside xylohydrolase
MLKNRQFNVVLITKETPKTLNFDNPEGKMVEYNGKAVSVHL